MKEKLALSNEKYGIVGLTGHVGIAHAHGANNYQQDDGGGSALRGYCIKGPGVDTRVREISCTTEKITVKLMGGGSASTMPEKGHTSETAMMKRAEGKDAYFPRVWQRKFWPCLRTGVAETAACFQAALAFRFWIRSKGRPG